ncbi:hypothetical protein GCM10007420_04660 [Glycocaulis albus]|jgi:hypothetical protein|uniref:Uncharacterized protein n=1 Tax=Glycocaulis albus TaxID=1382801 RepID=A0ABQ1XGX0_9PROT|nr:hypothetical protein [Glycocaulis albus]MBV5258393.1 hypothetical protein [Synechococcus moorigangaii CMS01]GGG92362.1 hypothetical protein GCM10007420_04660 [Glycocaulis albus]
MEPKRAPLLNIIAATGLAVSVAVLSYAGFEALFSSPTLSALTGAVVGGFVLGRVLRQRREPAHRA